jgi:hypothetical protein
VIKLLQISNGSGLGLLWNALPLWVKIELEDYKEIFIITRAYPN